jgi:hypothetical protein
MEKRDKFYFVRASFSFRVGNSYVTTSKQPVILQPRVIYGDVSSLRDNFENIDEIHAIKTFKLAGGDRAILLRKDVTFDIFRYFEEKK